LLDDPYTEKVPSSETRHTEANFFLSKKKQSFNCFIVLVDVTLHKFLKPAEKVLVKFLAREHNYFLKHIYSRRKYNFGEIKRDWKSH